VEGGEEGGEGGRRGRRRGGRRGIGTTRATRVEGVENVWEEAFGCEEGGMDLERLGWREEGRREDKGKGKGGEGGGE
jgi:hypothetical protein